MKIGFSGFVLGGGKAGIGVYAAGLLHALGKIDRKNNYEVHLTENEAGALSLPYPNMTTRVHPNRLANPFLNLLWQNTSLAALSKNYDLLHVPTIRRVPLIKGCPVVLTVHDLAPFFVREKYDPLRMLYHKQVLPKLVHRADRIIVVSEQTKNDLASKMGYPEDKISRIYPGVDHKTFHPVDDAKEKVKMAFGIDSPFFVYVSRIEHPGKNHLGLIRAFERFRREGGKPYHLVFVGADWPGAERVHEAAKKSPFSKEIHFLGYVRLQELPSLYSACELMVYPSFYEGFGLPVIEAMACGAPVACSNTSSLGEIGKGHALLFDPTKEEQISQALIDGTDPEFQRKARQDSPAYAKQFCWEKTAEETLKVYEAAR